MLQETGINFERWPILSSQDRRKWDALDLSARRRIRQKLTQSERNKRRTEKNGERRKNNIAIFDTETDPFDSENETSVLPFLGVLYSENFDPIIIWDNDFASFRERVINAILALPEPYTIYGHNAGRFDYYFLLNAFARGAHSETGRVQFKGRGIMSAKIGKHELRDSYHLLPEKLSAFEKDEFDYSKMKRENRERYKDEIIQYCINDCKYLLAVIKHFIGEYGFRLTVGQAALTQFKKLYKFDRLNETTDREFRPYYFGGRVECLAGADLYEGNYKLYDVNSMYPHVMASYKHPISASFDRRYFEAPNEHTYFIRLRCENQRALIKLSRERLNKLGVLEQPTVSGETKRGEFFTTIWEYQIAEKHGLLRDVEFLECIDFHQTSDFSAYILPIYLKREDLKIKLKAMKLAGLEKTQEYLEAKRWSIFFKLLMNAVYGKFAQDPTKFTEDFMCMPEVKPEYFDGLTLDQISDKIDAENWIIDTYLEPGSEREIFSIWKRPSNEWRFNNVAIGASITGAARSVLLDAIHSSTEPIYCDTDSLICADLGGVEFSPSKLGAWDLEGEFDQIAICGKKLYMCRNTLTGASKSAHKGFPALDWEHYLAMLAGDEIKIKAKGTTIYKDGSQGYLSRTGRVTATRRH